MVSSQIDEAFKGIYIDINETEVKQHRLKIVFHMLEIANEIRIISNAKIRRDNENEEDLRCKINA